MLDNSITNIMYMYLTLKYFLILILIHVYFSISTEEKTSRILVKSVDVNKVGIFNVFSNSCE